MFCAESAEVFIGLAKTFRVDYLYNSPPPRNTVLLAKQITAPVKQDEKLINSANVKNKRTRREMHMWCACTTAGLAWGCQRTTRSVIAFNLSV